MPEHETIRALLIEDFPFQARMLEDLLHTGGAEFIQLVWTDTLAKGLELLEVGNFELVLLDLVLPDSEGLETFQTVHRKASHLPIVILSGIDDIELAARAVSGGAQDYLVKGDVTAHTLVRTILYGIERKRAEEKLSRSVEVNLVLADLSKLLISSSSLDAISELILEQGKRLTQSPFGFAASLDPDTGDLLLTAASPETEAQAELGGERVGKREFDGPWGWALRNKRPLLTNDAASDSRAARHGNAAPGEKRFLAAPAIAQGKLMGLLALSGAGHDYAEYDLAIVERLASLLALAIERKTVAAELDRVHTELNQIFNAAIPLAVFAADGSIRRKNDSFCAIFGIDPRQNPNGKCHEATGCSYCGNQVCPLKSIVEGAESFQEELEYLIADGSRRQFLVQATPHRGPDGALIGAVVNYTDISARKKAEEGLKAMIQELEIFSYAIAHDLRAPLGAITKLVDWIREELAAETRGELPNYLRLLVTRVKRMEALINGILQYAVLGRKKEALQETEVGELLRETLDSLSPPPGFRIEIGPGMPRLRTQPSQLRQVFANLISNAVRHHDKAEGRIAISVDESADYYCFSVRDDGPGIGPEHHQKVFGFFQTLRPRDEFESVGIGLAIVKKLVEGQGGSVSVESEVGRGADFLFTWPKVQRGD